MPQLSVRVDQSRVGEFVAAPVPSPLERDKAIKILAKSIYREFKSQGFDPKQIVALATELISNVTTTARVGTGALLTLTGAFSASASQVASASSTAK